MLVRHQAKAGRAVAERGNKNRHVVLVSLINDALVGLAVLLKPRAHFADELTRAVRPWLKPVGNQLCGVVANAQLFFVDERVVDAIDHQLAQLAIERS